MWTIHSSHAHAHGVNKPLVLSLLLLFALTTKQRKMVAHSERSSAQLTHGFYCFRCRRTTIITLNIPINISGACILFIGCHCMLDFCCRHSVERYCGFCAKQNSKAHVWFKQIASLWRIAHVPWDISTIGNTFRAGHRIRLFYITMANHGLYIT